MVPKGIGLLLVLGVATPAAWAVTVAGFSPASNDRFANDLAYIAGGFDMSGVGRTADGRWATMITPNVFLSSSHFAPGPGTTLYFYPHNDPGATPVTAVVGGGEAIGTTDIWMGHLTVPLPIEIGSYTRTTETLTELNFSASTIAGTNAYLNGNTPTAGGYGADPRTSQATGRNVIFSFNDNQTFGVLGGGLRQGDVLLTVEDNPGEGDFVPFETQAQPGDSGAPLFRDSGGALELLGIGSAVGGASTFHSYTGNYATEIDAYIAQHPIPEPRIAVLGALALLVAGGMRRRRCSPDQDEI
ncbi:MAG: hypothetical protein HKN82_18440 [Akkermansiaceae bacterium]|nr:hypothetical protein [Akkermansiaceae bacterium]